LGSQMHVHVPAELLGQRFRLNPAFRIVAIEALTPAEVQGLGGVALDGELTSVLLPTVPALSAKAVCANTSRLLAALRTPAPLPPALRHELGADVDLIVRLLLDSVLEIEHDGTFVTGAAFAEQLRLGSVDAACDDAPARLSIEALRYAEALAIDHAPAL